ncbi:MAG: AraC family transcriptional regulator [Verrucomicrobiota bacterium]|nr:AraC family transcriptional regulator [Verrucomicrobiota bacterium]
MDTLRINQWELLNRQLVWATEGPVLPVNQRCAYGLSGLQAAWYLHEGSVEITHNRVAVRAGAGQWLFPAQAQGFQEFSSDARIVSIRFQVEWPTGLSLFNHDRALVVDGARVPRLLRTAARLASVAVTPAMGQPAHFGQMPVSLSSYLRLRTLFENWLQAYSDAMIAIGLSPRILPQLDERVLDAIRWIKHAPLHEPFRESTLAKHLGLSVSQLNRLFTRDLGQSPKQLYEERRQQVARFELSETAHPIKAIASNLGFLHPAHFTTWFRKTTGVSPTAYRVGI